jgi:hypothetical protein
MVMLPPASIVGKDGNPYLYLGGLGQAVDVLTRRLNADAISNPIKRDYPDAEFTVANDSSTTGPIIIIEASAPSKAIARTVMDTVVDSAEPALESLQNDLSVPTKSRITISAFAVDQDPLPDLKTRIQVVGAAGALGLILTLLLAVFVDGRIMARRRLGPNDAAGAKTAGAKPGQGHANSKVTMKSAARPQGGTGRTPSGRKI